jgi:hypothetical protein
MDKPNKRGMRRRKRKEKRFRFGLIGFESRKAPSILKIRNRGNLRDKLS